MTRCCSVVALCNDASTSCVVFSSSAPITYRGAIAFTFFHFITHHNTDISAVYNINYAIKPTNGCRQQTPLKYSSTGRRQSLRKKGRQGDTARSAVKNRDSLESPIRWDAGEVNAVAFFSFFRVPIAVAGAVEVGRRLRLSPDIDLAQDGAVYIGGVIQTPDVVPK